MYKHFKNKHPHTTFYYYLYRKSCRWTKVQFDVHTKKDGYDKENLDVSCTQCLLWKEHHEKYIAARKKYQADAENANERKLFVTADLHAEHILVYHLSMSDYVFKF